jgi:hypothetical protein
MSKIDRYQRRKKMSKKLALGFGLVSLFLLFPVLANAQSIPIVIPAYAFHAMDNDAQFNMAGGVLNADAASPYGWFTAPVYLPNGAGVTKFEVRARNNGASSFTVGLWRRNIWSNIEQGMASVSVTNTAGAWTTFTDTTINYWTVNTSGYGYYVCISFGSALGSNYQIEGVKIQYLPPV